MGGGKPTRKRKKSKADIKKKHKTPQGTKENGNTHSIDKISSSTELQNDLKQLNASDDTNAPIIFPGSQGKQKVDEEEERPSKKRKLSSKQKKRLQNYLERKAKAVEREKVFQSLSDHALQEEQLKLFHSSKNLGHRETAKEKLKRELFEERAGIQVALDDKPSRLVQQVEIKVDGKLPLQEISSSPVVETKKRKKASKEPKTTEARSQDKDKKKLKFVDEEEEDEEEIKRRKIREEYQRKEAEEAQQKKKAEEEKKKEEERKKEEEGKKEQERKKKEEQERKKEEERKKEAKKKEEEAKKREEEERRKEEERKKEKKQRKREKKRQQQQGKQQNEAQSHPSSRDLTQLSEPQEQSRGHKETEKQGKSQAKQGKKLTLQEKEQEISTESSQGKEKIEAKNAEKSQENSEDAIQSTKAVYVMVDRLPSVNESRMQLPVVMEEQMVMEHIKEHDVTIICGETGSGKTTQVPQFLYEAGYGTAKGISGMIGITEPRRVAAVSMAQRVSHELNLPFGKKVGYQIRYDTSSISHETIIKFMTDGILLKEIQSDFLLRKYSCVIIDEAHERSLNTDILIGLLSRIVPLRRSKYNEGLQQKKSEEEMVYPLKMVIMSATLRVEDFVKNHNLFKIPPPVVNIDARQFPVTVHFNKHTPENYMEETFKKVYKIHRKLPEGGILVFLTGQNEIESLCTKLRRKFPFKKKNSFKEQKKINPKENKKIIEKKAEKKEEEMNQEGEDVIIEEEDDEEEVNEKEESEDEESGPLYVLPLYSALPTAAQMKVFEAAPAGSRLCVVATNVAETSLTIPGIKYVVDSGKHKELHYDKRTGISGFVIDWVSQASANQRAGRAGRTGPGHCYRLYSSAMFNNHFQKFAEPEIMLTPIEGIVLSMKNMGINEILSFPFPTPPDKESLKAACKVLTSIGAIDKDTQAITKLGQTLAVFPVAPRFGKMLILGKQGGCLPYVIAIVAALSVRNPLLRETYMKAEEEDPNAEEQSVDEKEAQKLAKEEASKKRKEMAKAHSSFVHLESDLLAILKAIGAFHFAGCTEQFCEENFLHYKTMKEIHSLREQLTNIVNKVEDSLDLKLEQNLSPPTEVQEQLLLQIIAAGFVDQVAWLTRESNFIYYRVLSTEEKVFIHPSSFLAGELPECCVYKEIFYTSKPYLKGVTIIKPEWLFNVGKPLCTLSKPMEVPIPRYDPEADKIKCFVRVTYGERSFPLPNQEVEHPNTIDKFKFFARYLLEGQVMPQMKMLENYYTSKPSIITKSYTTNKITVLVHTLQQFNIDSKAKLVAKWKKDPNFLLSSLSLWVDREHHSMLKGMWPPLGGAPPPATVTKVPSNILEDLL